MTNWYTSDVHALHRLVSELRGFILEEGGATKADVERHTQAVIEAHVVVRKGDIVTYLGDMCASEKAWFAALELLKSLPGRKRLICGNHDPAWSGNKDAHKFKKAAFEVFENVSDFAVTTIGGKRVLISHFPYSGVGSEGLRGASNEQHKERYTEFRLTDTGTPLLHGHTHGPERLHYSQAGTPQVHVGLDAWNMKLVSEYEIGKLLASAEGSAKVEP